MLLEWLHVASARVPADVTASGALTGNISYNAGANRVFPWEGEFLVSRASLINPHAGSTSLVVGDVSVQSANSVVPETSRHSRSSPDVSPNAGFLLAPVSLALGGKDPATLEGHFDASGYTLHLTGMASTARLLALAAAIPQFGDGLATVLPTNRAAGPFRIDLTAHRSWGGSQTWTDTSARLPAARPRHLISN
jgi:hypothetical protein